jgi:hypothetical protein
LLAIAGRSLTVSKGRRPVGGCRSVAFPCSFISSFGALVSSLAALVPSRGLLVVSFCSVIPILGAPVPVISGRVGALKIVQLMSADGSSFFVHRPIMSPPIAADCEPRSLVIERI